MFELPGARSKHTGLSRRHVLLGATALAGASFLPSRLWAAAGEYSGGPIASGSTIPAATVRMGMAPFGDNSFFVIGMQQGFYNDVGISIAPAPLGESVLAEYVVPRLSSDSLDIMTWYAPSKVAVLPNTKNIVFLGFGGVYVGTYMLAAPWTGAKTVESLAVDGVSFADAMVATVAQMKGKRVGLANDGTHQQFFNTIFALGGIKPDEVNLQIIPDNTQIQLANSKGLDFASPAGAAQAVELMNQGWISIVGTESLLKGLPPGDARAVATVGNAGPVSTIAYVDANYETVLRFMSVMFRIIDQIHNEPLTALGFEAPYLRSVAGTSTTAEDLARVMSTLNPMYTFEQQANFWLDASNPYFYKNVYAPQIEAAVTGGLIPAGSTFTPDDVTVGARIYKDLVWLKSEYDGMLPSADTSKDLVKAAATQYKNRNYLDAYRLLKAAA